MKSDLIRADTFLLKKQRLRIFRVREQGTAVVLWTSEDHALRYLKHREIQRRINKRKKH